MAANQAAVSRAGIQHIQSIIDVSGAPHQGQVRVNRSTNTSKRLIVHGEICAYQAIAGGRIKQAINPYNAEIFMYLTWKLKSKGCFFNLKSS